MSLNTMYLGNPAGPFGMQAVPAIQIGGSLGNGGLTQVLSRGTITQPLLSGGTATLRRPKTKASYAISWRIARDPDVELLTSFFNGVQGSGPFCLVDPTWPNVFPPNVASMGAVLGALPEWSPSVGAIVPRLPFVAPPAANLSGVAAWSGAGSGSTLFAGLNAITDGTWLPPVIAGLSCRFSIWARTASGTASLTPRLQYGTAGVAPAGTASAGTAVALTTTWKQLSVTVVSSFSWPSTADYIVPELVCTTASAPILLLSSAEFLYSTSAGGGSVLSPWVSGIGVPRVLIPDTLSIPVGRPGYRDYAMTLREA